MKLVARSIKDYNEANGYAYQGAPVMQFIYTEGTSFGEFLKPAVAVEESKKVEFNMFDLLYTDKIGFSELDENEVGVLSEQEPVTLDNFTPNKSVCGLGVSLFESQTRLDVLSKMDCPIFVELGCEEHTLESYLEVLQSEYSAVSGFSYVLHSMLDYMGNVELLQKLVELGYNNVRLVGANVLNLKTNENTGLFHYNTVTRFALEYNYKENPNKVTKVAILEAIGEEQALENLNYTFKSTKPAGVSRKTAVSGGGGSAKSATPKAKKKTKSRLELFMG